MWIQLKIIGSIALLSFAAFGCRQDNGATDQDNTGDDRVPSVSEIMSRTAETYSNCQSYRDTGMVTTVYKSQRGAETEVKRFSTAMVRPDQFRFEYTEEGNPNSRYVIWRNGADVRTWWDVTQESERPASLGLALAGATGVSGSSAHTIPALLLPREVGGRMLTDLGNPKRGDDRVIDDHKCFTIEAQFADEPITIWIDQETFLVRRIDGTSTFDDFSTVESTTYDPVIDEDMLAKLLEYNAPE